METVLSVCLGIGLAAACGFRVFVPLLAMNLASRADLLQLTGGFAWMASDPALVVFAVATGLEIAAYYVPWLDNLLDTAASPLAVVAGVVVTASALTGVDPMLKWTLAVIAGGGAAGAVQAVTGLTRGASTLLTGGATNFLVASAEAVGSVVMSVLALFLPVLALIFFLAFLLVAGRLAWRRMRPAPAVVPSG